MIPQVHQVTDPQQQAAAEAISLLHREAVGFDFLDSVPDTDKVANGRMVIYDNGAGTMRVYFKTGKGNLGYVALT